MAVKLLSINGANHDYELPDLVPMIKQNLWNWVESKDTQKAKLELDLLEKIMKLTKLPLEEPPEIDPMEKLRQEREDRAKLYEELEARLAKIRDGTLTDEWEE